ncbi:MAG TPA: DUF928 domain-containing protein [Chroococcidiopsis sp.]
MNNSHVSRPGRSPLHRTLSASCVAIALAMGLLLSVPPQSAQAQSVIERIQALFSRRRSDDSASNRTYGGAVRDACDADFSPDSRLTALIPERSTGFTTEAYPTFVLYVPVGQASGSVAGQFVLLDDNQNPVLTTETLVVSLPENPGIVTFQLPSSEQPLALGKRYSWYFSITCQSGSRQTELSFVNSQIERVAPAQELVTTLANTPLPNQFIPYLQNDIWYDAIARLAEHRTEHPDDWTQLLTLYRLEALSAEDVTELQPPMPPSASPVNPVSYQKPLKGP